MGSDRNAPINDILRLERLRRRIPQREIAAATGIGASTLSSIENGWRAPSPEEVKRIARAIGIDPDELEEQAS